MSILQELNESRMYKRLEQITGRDLNDIAERLFEHLLALQIFANIDRGLASKYAGTIMRQQQFDGFRTSQPDLYNLITLILRKDRYSYVIDTEIDNTVSIPELRLRRNLRDLARGDFNNNDYSQMMLMLQRKFTELPGQLLQLRRQISVWDSLPATEHKTIIRRLLMQMRERGMQSDFYYHLSKFVQ